MPRKKDLENDIFANVTSGDVRYGSLVLAEALGNEEKVKASLIEAYKELKGSSESVSVVDTYRTLEDAQMRVRQDVDLSISAQLGALKEYAARNGYEVVKEYVDEVESGKTAARPAFREMISAQAPFGYCKVKVNDGSKERHKLDIEPNQARTVARIYSEALDVKGLIEVAKQLNKEGIAGPRGKGWMKTTIHKILTNEVYTGTMVWGSQQHM